LELPETEQQHADHSHDDVGGHGQPPLRQSIVVAKPVGHENPAREYFRLRAACPVRPFSIKLAGLNSRHEKNLQRGFRVDPDSIGVTPKMSVENFLDLGNEKIPRSSRITAGLELREAAAVFLKVSPA
jgi:hypothetical protein